MVDNNSNMKNVGLRKFRLPTTPFANVNNDSVDLSSDIFDSLIDDEYNDDSEKNSTNNLAFAVDVVKDPILVEIEDSYKQFKKNYSSGGIESSRFITSDILIKAPRGYFDKFDDTIKEGIQSIRNELVQESRSEIVSKAESNPTDEGIQNQAYFTVSSLASNFLENQGKWQGINRRIVHVLICDEMIGMGKLEPLWRDPKITEIFCNGPFDIQVEIAGEVLRVESCVFRDQQHLLDLIERLYNAVGKVLSPLNPSVKARMHNKSRLFATHPIISPDGPNLNIRKHPKGFFTPSDMVDLHAASPELMTWIGNMVYKGASFLVAGGMGSGKTTMLNALTGFYKDNARIVTLEDSIEMKPNPKKLLAAALECKLPSNERKNDTGVTMRDLVKNATQMRPDVIIVGETLDFAAYDLCQAMNVGHPGASTVHANSSQMCITRMSNLISQSELVGGQAALEMISAAFDFIIYIKRFPSDGSRRIVSIDEISTRSLEVDGVLTLETTPLWKFIDEGFDENGKVFGYWHQEADISDTRKANKLLDLEEDMNWDQLKELSSIPDEMRNE